MRPLAQLISVLLHPLLVPTYLLIWLSYGGAGALGTTPPAIAPGLLVQIWLLTFGLPSLLLWVLAHRGVISSVELPDRRQRTLPLLLAAACFGTATLLLASRLPQHPKPSRLFAAITLSILLTTLITRWWKISAHGVGMGGAIGLYAVLWQQQALPPLPARGWLLAALLLAAAVAWARLRLRAHTPAQVLAGLLLGATVSAAAAWQLWQAAIR